MEKANMTRAMRDFIQSTLPGFPLVQESSGRLLRGPAPVDRERARAACAPMGTLTTVVVTGIGVKTPAGQDLQTFWSTLLAGKSMAARDRSFR